MNVQRGTADKHNRTETLRKLKDAQKDAAEL